MRGRGTDDAIQELLKLVRSAFPLYNYIVGTALDITGAFDIVKWDTTNTEMKKMKFPAYI